MRKLLGILLVISIVLITGSARAELDDDPRRTFTTVFKGADATLTTAEFDRTKDALIGIRVIGKAVVVGVYDCAAVGANTEANIVTEAEALYSNGISMDSDPFPFRKIFSSAITVIFNDGDIEAADAHYGVLLYIESDYNKYN
ncbi:unnamed protein product [marine sediment metagenome]|uniref:Uncharacterized protein n=1 Tax=marine sediment metagenome TaxID=412755 RepID=X1RGG5_9ZZZZ